MRQSEVGKQASSNSNNLDSIVATNNGKFDVDKTDTIIEKVIVCRAGIWNEPCVNVYFKTIDMYGCHNFMKKIHIMDDKWQIDLLEAKTIPEHSEYIQVEK
jgi:hypothetical protein